MKEASGVLGTDIAMNSPEWNVDEGHSGSPEEGPKLGGKKSRKEGYIEVRGRSAKVYPEGSTTMDAAELTKKIKELPGVNAKNPTIYEDPDTGEFWAFVNFSSF